MNQETIEYAKHLDRQDVLASFRSEFYLPTDTIYLDGNSLGLCSSRAEESLHKVVNQWKECGIGGWTTEIDPWFNLAEELGAKMSPLVGVKPHEVIVTGSTTVNLHQLLATFYKPQGKRKKILADELNFPSDIYAIESQLRLHGFDPSECLVIVKSRDGKTIREEDIIQLMTPDVALIILPTVCFRSGQLLDVECIMKAARERGIKVGFDACHSVGAIPHFFNKWGVDFAFWCTYKYLNSGPGGVAAIYVNEMHHGCFPGLAGWFSSKKEQQFDMRLSLDPAPDVGAFQIGTPHILSVAPLMGSLAMFSEAKIERIREKSLQLTRYLMNLVESNLTQWNFKIENPLDDRYRGGHVCLEHKEAIRICKALKEVGVIVDYRAPMSIRLAPVALYTTFEEVWSTVMRLKNIMIEEKYEKYSLERGVVA